MRVLLSATLLSVAGISPALAGSTYVDGHFRRDGTYVQPHFRTTPDSSRLNNWSTQGNSNPYTGRQGTVDPYAQPTYRGYGGGVNNLNKWGR